MHFPLFCSVFSEAYCSPALKSQVSVPFVCGILSRLTLMTTSTLSVVMSRILSKLDRMDLFCESISLPMSFLSKLYDTSCIILFFLTAPMYVHRHDLTTVLLHSCSKSRSVLCLTGVTTLKMILSRPYYFIFPKGFNCQSNISPQM